MRLINRQHNRWAIRYRPCVVAGLVLFWISMAPAVAMSGEVLDDSLSPRQQYTMQFDWVHKERPSRLNRSEYLLQKARIPNVEVRLDTSGYIGQSARIYLKLPEQIDGLAGIAGFLLTWTTRGMFLSGEIRPGGRSLIYDGGIKTPVMGDFFSFTLTVDADEMTGTLKYAPVYEIETD
jgi:hypothetical protein